jgi:hypothetical protein
MSVRSADGVARSYTKIWNGGRRVNCGLKISTRRIETVANDEFEQFNEWAWRDTILWCFANNDIRQQFEAATKTPALNWPRRRSDDRVPR